MDDHDDELYRTLRARPDLSDLHGNGRAVDRYEAALADVFGSRWAISTASGTAALYAALVAVGVRPGSRVAVPNTAPAMSVLPICALGAEPVLCDVQAASSFGLDLDDLHRLDDLAAVMAVPMWGYWDEDPRLADLLAARDLPLVVDAAQAHHVRLAIGPLTRLATVVCYSTHARKPLSTGEGGFCLCDDEAVACALRSVRNFGQDASAVDGRILARGPYAAQFGLNLKLSGVLASIGRCALTDLQADLEGRVAAATALAGAIESWPLPVAEMRWSRGSTRGLYGLGIHLLRHDSRAVGAALAEACLAEIESHRYAYNLAAAAPFLRPFGRPTPHAQELVESIVTIRLAGFDPDWAAPLADALASALATAPLRSRRTT